MSRDPVCGSWVDEQQAPQSEFQGQIYYFCSQDYDDPERYAGWGGTALSGSA